MGKKLVIMLYSSVITIVNISEIRAIRPKVFLGGHQYQSYVSGLAGIQRGSRSVPHY